MIEKFKQAILRGGAQRVATISGDQIVFNPGFREMCAINGCGCYGKCYMCPPDVGPIDELIAAAQQYKSGILYQSIYEIEDSFDFEGMMDARRRQSLCVQAIERELSAIGANGYLHLAVGGCGVCKRCAKQDSLPCRYPDKALPSMEAYGVDVGQTAAHAGLKYINGQNTVTYFGLLLIGENAHV